MKELLRWHLSRYPAMQAQDAVKLVFQSLCGCGHILADEMTLVHRIQQEEALLTPDPAEPLTEPLGSHVRLNLRRAMAEGIQPDWIARLMIFSAKQNSVKTDRQSVYNIVESIADGTELLSAEAIRTCARRLIDEPEWIPGHTQVYRDVYAPAYRVISRQAERILPVLCALEQHNGQERLLICIDGPCGSGKSTFAQELAEILDAAVIPMDDFFTPHGQKTPERLAQPGGNADIERFCEEVMAPWVRGETVAYRPYVCWQDTFAAPRVVPTKRITIIEGSYSLHPQISSHADLRIYLTIDSQEQKRRILARDGETMLQRFLDLWIPLEQAYSSFFGLPDKGCLVLSGSTDV